MLSPIRYLSGIRYLEISEIRSLIELMERKILTPSPSIRILEYFIYERRSLMNDKKNSRPRWLS